MFDHISLGITNIEKAVSFYDPVMKTLGHDRYFGTIDTETMAYGLEHAFFVICAPLEPEKGMPKPCNGTHICFSAQTRAQVHDFYEIALENGGQCAGKPGLREEYDSKYYAAFIYDLDGHKIEAVTYSQK